MNNRQKSPKILVSHPVRQHAHQLVYGLQKQGWLQKFITSVWYKPNHWLVGNLVKFITKIKPSFIKQVKKRYFQPLQEDLIEIFPIPELIRLYLQRIFKPKHDFKWFFEVEKWHDRYVAHRIKKLNPDIFIGYEHASLKSFKTAKKLGKITILDLAQVHHDFLIQLRKQFPILKEAVLADDDFFEKTNRIKAERLKYVDYVFTLSEMSRQGLIRGGVDEKKIFLIYLGFEPSNFQPRTFYPKTGKFRILYVGGLTEHKGIRLILEAIKNLQLPDIEFNIVGTATPDSKELLEEYQAFHTYIPFQHHEELIKLYQTSDIFVLPSYVDGWGMVVTEAMACGTPVIVSENTGTAELVAQGAGFVIPPGDRQALQEKILYLYQNREQIEIFGRKAHEIVQKYTWENYHLQLKNTIEKIWSTHSG